MLLQPLVNHHLPKTKAPIQHGLGDDDDHDLWSKNIEFTVSYVGGS